MFREFVLIQSSPSHSTSRNVVMNTTSHHFVRCSACNERVQFRQFRTHWDICQFRTHLADWGTTHHSSTVLESKRYSVLADPSDSESVHLFQIDNAHNEPSTNIRDVTPPPSASIDDTGSTSDCGPDNLSQYASDIAISDLKIKVQNMNQNGSSPLEFSALFEPKGSAVTESVNDLDFEVAEIAMRPTMELSASLLEPNPSSVPINNRSRLLVPIAANMHTASFNVILSEVFQELHGQYEEDWGHLESMTISRNDSKEERHWMEMYPAPLPSLRCIPRQNSVCNIQDIFDCQTTIGFGSSCTVMKAQNIENGKFVALKQIPKGQRKGGGMTSQELLSNERALLDALEQQENVVRLLAVYETPGHFFLATELLTGNETE